jgi:DNA uptake protein ComE-like DNA-binding protein
MIDSKIRFDRTHSVKLWQTPIVALLLIIMGFLGGCNSKPDAGNYPAEKSSATKPAATTSKIDINSASIAELDKLELPGTKPSLSERIQGKRPYANADDLVGKKAISADEYKLIKNLIVVGNAK